MISADILRRLSQLKLPARALQEVLCIIADVQEEVDQQQAVAEEKRSRNAERMRTVRAQQTHSANTNGAQCDAQCSTPPSPLVPSSSSPPHPPNNYTPDPPSPRSLRSLAPKTRATHGKRLPEDWLPTAEDLNFARELLGPRSEIEVPKFCDYWHSRAGSGGVKLDWSATWRNWCRKAAESPYNGNSNGCMEKTNGRRRGSALDALDELFGSGNDLEGGSQNGHRTIDLRLSEG